MNVGLLWFDDDPRKSIEEKVQRVAAHYKRKYGRMPDLCYVHPGVLSGDGGKVKTVDQVEVRARLTVLPHHFWVGMRDGGEK